MRTVSGKLAAWIAAIILHGWTAAQVTERVNVGPSGVEGNSFSALPDGAGRVISADGRNVIFRSFSTNLVPGDTNAAWDLFLRDRLLGATERISVATGGQQAIGSSGLFGMDISADGRLVAFYSEAVNLVPGDTNGVGDIFVRDRQLGTAERVSVPAGGGQANGPSLYPALSADGRYVAFESSATNLVPGDANGTLDIFVHDRQNGSTELVSVGVGGIQGDQYSDVPSISGDGRYVSFHSLAENLVPGDTNGSLDVFVRDRVLGTTARVSLTTGGAQANSHSSFAALSRDGGSVAFVSNATNLVPGDTNGTWDIFVRNLHSGTTERVSVATGGAEAAGFSNSPSISSDGRFVAFTSGASNLVPGDTGYSDVFIRDRAAGTTEIASVATNGTFGAGSSNQPSISDDGRYVVFLSAAANLVPRDSNATEDVFLHDRAAAGFASLCPPSANGRTACPCENPPSFPGRGCDNSAATGGAVLSASGVAYLSMDSLAFTARGERASALSILLQGSSADTVGVPYGQGLRCVQGPLRRLYARTAVGGGVTLPDLVAGDTAVSARSYSLGDPIRPGQSRYYLVAYRDPIVLGGCDAWRTFNATQTGKVTWWP